jgi:serine/threonine-protein kinase HipA
MARELDVYLDLNRVGKLLQDNHGEITFQYHENWIHDPQAVSLSQSLPLRKQEYTRRECIGFFNGILPEGKNREIAAKNVGVSAKNDVALLEQIGGECAGAITFLSSGQRLAAQIGRYRPLSDHELGDILRKLPRRPLLAGEDHVRLSLAGAQDKLAVFIDAAHSIALPLDGAPSTHILKPASGHYNGIVDNELLCMKLAHVIGLPTPAVARGEVEGIEYLLVERYDRVKIEDQPLERLHQEDFCQALGIVSTNKYQNEGGPSLRQCFQLLRDAGSFPVVDIVRLLDAVIFNFLIGNHDAHGKNFSLLYRQNKAQARVTSLAPFYDLICTDYYPDLSKKMAMKIGGEYDSEKVYPGQFERFADEGNLNKPMVRRRVLSIAQEIQASLPEVTPEHPVGIGVAALIRARCTRTIERFKKSEVGGWQ